MCKTDLPTTTSMRAPGVVQSVFIIETIVDHVANSLGLSPDVVRQRNFYKAGQTTPYGQTIKYITLPTVWSKLMTETNYDATMAACTKYNGANRWRKRGVCITPIKYGLTSNSYIAGCMIRIHPADGTVQVTHGGCEIGQGINTKVAQTVAFELGCPLEMIEVTATSSDKVPVASITGGSGTSETCCAAAINGCATLNKALAPIRAANPKATWAELVATASGNLINLQTLGWYAPTPPSSMSETFMYYVFAAACSEVEVDVLTGEIQVLESDIYYDCGISLNPDVDIGQIEGAFMMGLGYFLTEHEVYGAAGELESTGTWNYKPPFNLDIPQQLNVK